MPKKIKYQLPQSVFVYVGDREPDGEPILYLTESISEISEDANGELIGEYQLGEVGKISIARTIIKRL